MIQHSPKKKFAKARKKSKSSPLQVSKLFRKILPDGFQSKTALINQYQQFFNSLETDAVFQMVKVVSIDANTITVSLPSSGLVNYLRLHSQQVCREIDQQFGQVMVLKIISSPVGAQNELPHPKIKPAPHFSAEVSDKIKTSARNVDDEDLRQSLIRLADAIRKKDV